MNKEEPASAYCLFTPSHGKKTSRSPTTTFLSYIQKLLVDSEGMLTPATILETAQGRTWKKNLWSPAQQPSDDDDDITASYAMQV